MSQQTINQQNFAYVQSAMNELNQIQFSSSRQKEVMFTLHRNALERVKQNYDLNIKERLQEAATHSFV